MLLVVVPHHLGGVVRRFSRRFSIFKVDFGSCLAIPFQLSVPFGNAPLDRVVSTPILLPKQAKATPPSSAPQYVSIISPLIQVPALCQPTGVHPPPPPKVNRLGLRSLSTYYATSYYSLVFTPPNPSRRCSHFPVGYKALRLPQHP